MSIWIAVALLAAQAEAKPAIQLENAVGPARTIQVGPADDRAKIDEAARLIKGGNPAAALPLLDAVITHAEKRHPNKDVLVFSARSLVEALVYSGLSATRKKSSVVLDDAWSFAHFLKGFALIDLRRADEAKLHLDKAVALAPMNAQFLGERGEWFKARKDWTSAFKDFEAASSAAELSPDDLKTAEKGRALRGMAFVRIEQGELKEAETLLKQALQLDRNDAKARHELDYIRSLQKG